MLNIKYHDQPARFGFSLTESGNLAIDIEPEVWLAAQALLNAETAVRFHPVHIADRQFIPACEPQWGFGTVLTTGTTEEGWIRIGCPLPLIIKGDQQDFAAGCAVSASLNFLLKILNYWDFTPATKRPQLMTIDGLMAEPESSGASLAGKVSPIMTEWTRQQAAGRQPQVESFMCRAFNSMERGTLGPTNPHEFIAHYRHGTIGLVCPGNACDLACDGMSFPDPGEGYELVCHNTDSVSQQLTFLIGLAAIHDLARAELWTPEHS